MPSFLSRREFNSHCSAIFIKCLRTPSFVHPPLHRTFFTPQSHPYFIRHPLDYATRILSRPRPPAYPLGTRSVVAVPTLTHRHAPVHGHKTPTTTLERKHTAVKTRIPSWLRLLEPPRPLPYTPEKHPANKRLHGSFLLRGPPEKGTAAPPLP